MAGEGYPSSNGGNLTAAQILARLIGATTLTAGALLFGDGTATVQKLLPEAAGNVLLSGSTPSWGKVDLTQHITGNLPVGNLANNSITLAKLQQITTTRLLGRSTAGAGDIEQISIGSGLSLSGGTLSTSGVDAATLNGQAGSYYLALGNATGQLAVDKGGTNLTSYTIGDLLYADGTTSLAKLAGVATGNALISGGVGTAPSWGKIGLTTHVSGLLPVANGGTGAGSFVANELLFGNGTSAVQSSAELSFVSNVLTLGTAAILSLTKATGTTLTVSSADAAAINCAGGATFASGNLIIRQSNDVELTNSASTRIIRTSGNVGSDIFPSEAGHLVLMARSSAARHISFWTGTTTPVERARIDGNGIFNLYNTDNNAINCAGGIVASGTLSGGAGSFANTATPATNNSSVHIYRTAGGGSGDFSAAGHLWLQGRTSTGTPRDIILAVGDTTAAGKFRIYGTTGQCAVLDTADSASTATGSFTSAGGAGFAKQVSARNYLSAGGTITASRPVFDATQTWNSGAVTFTGIKLNVTDTASAAASLLLDLQVGGSSKFSVNKAGELLLVANIVCNGNTDILLGRGSTTTTIAAGTSASSGANIRLAGPSAGTVQGELRVTGTAILSWTQSTIGILDSGNIVLGTATGTKIGTSTTQKLGLWNATPVIQPASANQAAVSSAAATNTTPYGYATAAQADGIVTLLNEIRSALVSIGAIKGAA